MYRRPHILTSPNSSLSPSHTHSHQSHSLTSSSTTKYLSLLQRQDPSITLPATCFVSHESEHILVLRLFSSLTSNLRSQQGRVRQLSSLTTQLRNERDQLRSQLFDARKRERSLKKKNQASPVRRIESEMDLFLSHIESSENDLSMSQSSGVPKTTTTPSISEFHTTISEICDSHSEDSLDRLRTYVIDTVLPQFEDILKKRETEKKQHRIKIGQMEQILQDMENEGNGKTGKEVLSPSANRNRNRNRNRGRNRNRNRNRGRNRARRNLNLNLNRNRNRNVDVGFSSLSLDAARLREQQEQQQQGDFDGDQGREEKGQGGGEVETDGDGEEGETTDGETDTETDENENEGENEGDSVPPPDEDDVPDWVRVTSSGDLAMRGGSGGSGREQQQQQRNRHGHGHGGRYGGVSRVPGRGRERERDRQVLGRRQKQLLRDDDDTETADVAQGGHGQHGYSERDSDSLDRLRERVQALERLVEDQKSELMVLRVAQENPHPHTSSAMKPKPKRHFKTDFSSTLTSPLRNAKVPNHARHGPLRGHGHGHRRRVGFQGIGPVRIGGGGGRHLEPLGSTSGGGFGMRVGAVGAQPRGPTGGLLSSLNRKRSRKNLNRLL